jgi:glutathionylspermidine synthase
MQSTIRQTYNRSFSQEKYQYFLDEMNKSLPKPIEFRVAETPVFVPISLKQKLIETCESIVDVIVQEDFNYKTSGAIPQNQNVPNENTHTSFLAVDFAVCQDEKGEYIPQLIELQGFPSLFGFQYFLSENYQKHFPIPEEYDFQFNNHDRKSYIEELKKIIIGEEAVENVIILEIYPETQKTRADFDITEKLIGVKAVCLTKILKEGRKLFYLSSGKKIPINRIYNRIIFDDLSNYPNLKTEFNLMDEVDIEWIGHPNWFFRISKYTMPFLNHQYIPECRFLSEYQGNYPENLSEYVLKPLFSFAGTGVIINVSQSDLVKIKDPQNYILQKKVKYEPVIKTTDGSKVKCEIRMLYIWHKGDLRPTLFTNLARLSRGEMIGVRYNQDFDWVGGSVCFMEK